MCLQVQVQVLSFLVKTKNEEKRMKRTARLILGSRIQVPPSVGALAVGSEVVEKINTVLVQVLGVPEGHAPGKIKANKKHYGQRS